MSYTFPTIFHASHHTRPSSYPSYKWCLTVQPPKAKHAQHPPPFHAHSPHPLTATSALHHASISRPGPSLSLSASRSRARRRRTTTHLSRTARDARCDRRRWRSDSRTERRVVSVGWALENGFAEILLLPLVAGMGLGGVRMMVGGAGAAVPSGWRR